MAPEQWDSMKEVGPPADVYALGSTFYKLLAGEEALQADSHEQMWHRTCVEPFPDIRGKRPDVPPQLAGILAKCTAKEPEARYIDAGEFAESTRVSCGGLDVKRDLGHQPASAGHGGETTGPSETVLSRINSLVEEEQGRLGGSTSLTQLSSPKPEAAIPAQRPFFRGSRFRLAAALGLVAVLLIAVLLLRGLFWPSGPLSASAQLWCRAGEEERPLEAGSILNDKEEVWLEFAAKEVEPVYLYICAQDQEGAQQLLFPHPLASLRNPLAGHETHRLPGKIFVPETGGYQLNHWRFPGPQDETIFVLAARAPIETIDVLAEQGKVGYPTLSSATLSRLRKAVLSVENERLSRRGRVVGAFS